MKVTFVLPGFARNPGGGTRVVYSLANELVERGHHVTVVHVAFHRRRPSLSPRLARTQLAEVVGGSRDLRFGAPLAVEWQYVAPEVDLRYVPILTRTAVPDGDVIVATAWQTAESVSRLPARKGDPFYLIQGLETWSGTPARVDATWHMPMQRVFIAPWLLRRAQALGLEDLHRIAPGIDLELFRITRDIASRSPKVAMLYSGWEGKGSAVGIAVLESARSLVPELQATLFGVGRRPARLPSWIEYHANPSQAELSSRVYNHASIYLCPSRSEGWHLPPAEAMACGCAVVSTDIDGVADYAFDGRTALLAPVDDVEELAAQVVGLTRNDEQRVDIATAGRKYIEKFTWSASAAALERAFASRQPAQVP